MYISKDFVNYIFWVYDFTEQMNLILMENFILFMFFSEFQSLSSQCFTSNIFVFFDRNVLLVI